MLCSNEALKFVNYPTQVLAKSCKLVPVLLVNLVIYRRKQSIWQYLHVTLVTLGILLFRWRAGREAGESNTTYGLLLLAVSLFLDGVTGPTQEWIRDKYRPSSEQFILYCNVWAIVYIVALLAVAKDGVEGIVYILSPENSSLLFQVVIFSLCGTFGQNFIFLTLRDFGYVFVGPAPPPACLAQGRQETARGSRKGERGEMRALGVWGEGGRGRGLLLPYRATCSLALPPCGLRVRSAARWRSRP
jgi:drug/metabolite transporter (DMT)-like permease